MKRALDVVVSLAGLALLAPALAAIAVAVWGSDRSSPWFLGLRVARGGGAFRMRKFRSMRPDAWKAGIHSTAAGDPRITAIGRLLRHTKLDELPQLMNVLAGDMSLVGPRPQVQAEAALYTEEERRLLAVRPGITDLASIVFADEAEILAGSADPDLLYQQIIRPWKSRLALVAMDHASVSLDIYVVFLTLFAALSRRRALDAIARLLVRWKAEPALYSVARRREPLRPFPAPGAERVVERYGVRDGSEHRRGKAGAEFPAGSAARSFPHDA